MKKVILYFFVVVVLASFVFGFTTIVSDEWSVLNSTNVSNNICFSGDDCQSSVIDTCAEVTGCVQNAVNQTVTDALYLGIGNNVSINANLTGLWDNFINYLDATTVNALITGNFSLIDGRVDDVNTSANVEGLGFNTTSKLDVRYLQNNGSMTDGLLCSYNLTGNSIVCANQSASGDTDTFFKYSNQSPIGGLNLSVGGNFSIIGCADTQVLKMNSNTWECAADATGGGDFVLNVTNGTVDSAITNDEELGVLAGSTILVGLSGNDFTVSLDPGMLNNDTRFDQRFEVVSTTVSGLQTNISNVDQRVTDVNSSIDSLLINDSRFDERFTVVSSTISLIAGNVSDNNVSQTGNNSDQASLINSNYDNTMRLDQSGWFNGSDGYISWDSINKWNDFNESKITTTFYNATSYNLSVGTGSGQLSYLQVYDNVPYNITEDGSDIDFYINFTGVDDFNNLIIRYSSVDEDTLHTMNVYIWNYGDSDWESYGYLPATGDYQIVEFGVFDPDEHLDGNIVQVRILQEEGAPVKTHLHLFDWISLSKGLGTPSGAEVDPFSVYKDGTVPLTGNWNVGGFNIYSVGQLNATDFFDDGVNITARINANNLSMAENDTAQADLINLLRNDVDTNNESLINLIAIALTTGTSFLGDVTGTSATMEVQDGSHVHAGENISTGTVADARIASTIARDSELVDFLVNGTEANFSKLISQNGLSVNQTRVLEYNGTTICIAVGGCG